MAELELKIKAVIGFSGKIINSLHYSPCGKYVVYPLGSLVVVKNLKTEKESFLEGHSYEITCLRVSNDGSKIASGQTNQQGVKADVIVWDFNRAKSLCDAGKVMIGEDCLLHRLRQHLSKVQGCSFSTNSEFLCTYGGQDDNAIVIWRVEDGSAICGSPAASDAITSAEWLHGRDDRVVSAGYYHLRVWQINFVTKKLNPMDAKMGTLRRIIDCLAISEDDHFAYCGTNTGDVVKVKIDRNDIASPNDPDTMCPVMVSCSKERFAQGVRTVLNVQNEATGGFNVVVGCGDGTVAYLNPSLNSVTSRRANVIGGIASLSVSPSGRQFMAGTELCNMYLLSADLAQSELKMSCHNGLVNDLAFPEGCPDLIVTSSVGDIRIWNVRAKQEMLRIQVPNLECLCCNVTPSGGSIISGWNDGKIRAFFPESGRMKFVIPDAHSEKVTALALADNDSRGPWRIVSGGSEGKVRVWNVTSSHQAWSLP